MGPRVNTKKYRGPIPHLPSMDSIYYQRTVLGKRGVVKPILPSIEDQEQDDETGTASASSESSATFAAESSPGLARPRLVIHPPRKRRTSALKPQPGLTFRLRNLLNSSASGDETAADAPAPSLRLILRLPDQQYEEEVRDLALGIQDVSARLKALLDAAGVVDAAEILEGMGDVRNRRRQRDSSRKKRPVRAGAALEEEVLKAARGMVELRGGE